MKPTDARISFISAAVLTLMLLCAGTSVLQSGELSGARSASADPIWIYDSDLTVTHVETADLNADNIKDVIASEYSSDYYGTPSRVLAIDGATGDTIWSYLIQDGIRSMTIGDLNNDGVADVVLGASYNATGTPDGQIHALDGKDGAVIFTCPIGATIEDVVIGNFTGDENMDVVAASFDDYVYAVDGESGALLWSNEIGSMFVNAVAAADVNNDNIDDVAYAHEYLAGYDNYYGMLDGTDGSDIWADTVPYVVVDVLLADVDGDSDIELIVGGIYSDDHAELFVRDAAKGDLEWSYNLGSVEHVNGNILIETHDVDQDTDLDIVVGLYLGPSPMLAFDGSGPTAMWVADPIGVNTRDMTFGDFTGDYNLEIAVAGGDRVVVLKADGGEELYYYAVGGSMYSVATGDFDDDGVTDIAAGGGADFTGTPPNPLKSVWALKTVVSTVKWEFDFGSYGNAIAMGDLNGDGCDDVVGVCSSTREAWAIDGDKGTELWHWQASDNLFCVTIDDFDGNGLGDVAVGGYDNIVTALNGETGLVLWQFVDATDDYYRKCLKSADLNGDGNFDVIAGNEDNFIYAINGESGGSLWSYDCGSDATDVIVMQMNGTGPLDVIATVGSGKVVVVDGSDGSELWTFDGPAGLEHLADHNMLDFPAESFFDVFCAVTPSGTKGVIKVNSESHDQDWFTPLAIGSNTHGMWCDDVNDDGVADVAVNGGTTASYVTLLDGVTGEILWDFPTGGEVNTVVIYDVNLDGLNEVIAGSDDQNVYALNGQTGELIWNYSTADDVIHVLVGDVDCDGRPNIACVTFGSDGVIYAFESLAPIGPSYVCGDADGSEAVDIDDVVFLITYIFASGPAPDPLDSGEVDCTGAIDIDDVVYLIAYIFASGPAPCANCL
ncbi:MAG: PQQ-binding-like beta-propeller repeat protein [candidate division Zixibacteria bacterium]|nr:PQQ-binding-like beta-propeller repeat protein [candidate division Zixibacteria bacterium]MBU1471982.1 PQQ-binding-like beta-propeller repeat protein [candidate division Zixibacteria bacterium]MBU2626917.1 PQQ-binding-like beta-propeller repeat protein [candidate division Zixibacteria bacterium]